jgi:hypothetical protein
MPSRTTAETMLDSDRSKAMLSEMIPSFANVMDVQNVMIDDAFDQVKQARSGSKQTHQPARCVIHRLVCRRMPNRDEAIEVKDLRQECLTPKPVILLVDGVLG